MSEIGIININGTPCINPNNLTEINTNMWFKTDSGQIHQIKYIDLGRPLINNQTRFAIVYSKDDESCWGLDSIVATSWNPNDFKTEDEKFGVFLDMYQAFNERIKNIIQSAGKSVGKNYYLLDIEISDDNSIITLELGYGPYSNGDSDKIVGTCDVFYNDEIFNKFIEDNKKKAEELESKKRNEQNSKVEDAKKILRNAGYDVIGKSSDGYQKVSNGNNYRD